jgi:hypothetical protein
MIIFMLDNSLLNPQNFCFHNKVLFTVLNSYSFVSIYILTHIRNTSTFIKAPFFPSSFNILRYKSSLNPSIHFVLLTLIFIFTKGVVSIMNKRNALPTCGAARPTPHALYIVSYILAIVSFNSGCSCEIFSPTFLKTGWPYPTIGKIIIIILSIISPKLRILIPSLRLAK